MNNEKEVEVELVEEDLTKLDENTDWKAKAQEIEQKRREDGIRNRERTKALKAKLSELEPKTPATDSKTKEGFDLAERAYLKTEGIEREFFPFVEKVMKETGKTVDEVLESKYFKAELKELREEKVAKEALPTGSKRSAPTTRDDVDYWLAKGELPPADQVELRRKVVNAKYAKEKNKTQFTSRPVV